MQPNPPVPHGQKSHAQHQWNGDAYHQPRARVDVPAPPPGLLACPLVQAQADKTYSQHDGHGLDEHLDEFIDGTGHGLGLVLHIGQAHSGGKRFFDVRRGGIQGFAQADDVAALGHRNPQGHDLAPLMPHLDGGGLHIPAPDGRNIPQAQLRTRGTANRHGAQFFNGAKLPRHTHL